MQDSIKYRPKADHNVLLEYWVKMATRGMKGLPEAPYVPFGEAGKLEYTGKLTVLSSSFAIFMRKMARRSRR